MSSIVEWKDERYAGVQHTILNRCIIGGVEHLSGGEDVCVRLGKSAAARKWEAVFIRRAESTTESPSPPKRVKENTAQKRPSSKRRKTTAKKPSASSSRKEKACSSKKRGAKVDDDVSCSVILAF